MIIKPAIAELNEKSDLVVTVETIKKGRTVLHPAELFSFFLVLDDY
ncbi:hypothetical protein ACSLOE_30310 [Escherichia coli]